MKIMGPLGHGAFLVLLFPDQESKGLQGLVMGEKPEEGEVSRPKKPRPKLRGPAQSGMRKTGKTARKRQKKLEKIP